MKIDPTSGTVMLPSGMSIGADCTREEFEATGMAKEGRGAGHGNAPWVRYQFSGGEVDGHELLVVICFYGSVLVDVELTVCLYAADQRDWSHYSLDVEAATKRLHEEILTRQFGRPQIGAVDPSGGYTQEQSILRRRADWHFLWGDVFSCHDSKGGGTSLHVRYGDRMETARAADLSR